MIPMWIGKMIATWGIKAIKHRIDLKKIDRYVNKPNDLDIKVKKIQKEIKALKKIAHPVADFVCTDCGTKAKRIRNKLKKIRRK